MVAGIWWREDSYLSFLASSGLRREDPWLSFLVPSILRITAGGSLYPQPQLTMEHFLFFNAKAIHITVRRCLCPSPKINICMIAVFLSYSSFILTVLWLSNVSVSSSIQRSEEGILLFSFPCIMEIKGMVTPVWVWPEVLKLEIG